MLRLKYNNKERIIMGKKNYLIIGGTILIFVVAIIVILLLGNNNTNDWTKEIKEAQNYEITMTDCNGREKKLEQNILDYLSEKWKKLSNNGPWTGNSDKCYTNISISYDTNGIVKEKNIIIIDNKSLVLELDTKTIYYTNGEEIINHLNGLFTE